MAPVVTMSFIHAFNDAKLTATLQDSLGKIMKPDQSFDVKAVEQDARFQSFFSEILRTYLATFIARCAPNHDVPVNEWVLPKNSVMMLNTYVTHHDIDVWNTQDERHPIGEFWAERFLLFPNDPTSGPSKQRVSESLAAAQYKGSETQIESPGGPKYSIDGLKGSFIPFGGKITILS